MAHTTWRKSSYSGGNGEEGDCVEVALSTTSTGVRDSKTPGHRLDFTPVAWRAFLAAVRER
jgi:hypothetical protein